MLSLSKFAYLNIFLLYLSVCTRGVIGQFCGPYSTVRHLIDHFFSVRTVTYRSSYFPIGLWPAHSVLGPS